MIQIDKTQEVRAPLEKIWKLIADLENEHKYWPTLSEVKILSRKDNAVEREVKIKRGPLGEAKSVQTLTLNPDKKSTTLTMTKGPMIGTRKISLTSTSADRTKIDVNWEFEMKGVPGFALGYVKENMADATEKALAQIEETALK